MLYEKDNKLVFLTWRGLLYIVKLEVCVLSVKNKKVLVKIKILYKVTLPVQLAESTWHFWLWKKISKNSCVNTQAIQTETLVCRLNPELQNTVVWTKLWE